MTVPDLESSSLGSKKSRMGISSFYHLTLSDGFTLMWVFGVGTEEYNPLGHPHLLYESSRLENNGP